MGAVVSNMLWDNVFIFGFLDQCLCSYICIKMYGTTMNARIVRNEFRRYFGGTGTTIGMDRPFHEIVLHAWLSTKQKRKISQLMMMVYREVELWKVRTRISGINQVLQNSGKFFFAIKYFQQRYEFCVVVNCCGSPNYGAIVDGIARSLRKVEDLPESMRHNPKRFADFSLKIPMWQVPSSKWSSSTFVLSAIWFT